MGRQNSYDITVVNCTPPTRGPELSIINQLWIFLGHWPAFKVWHLKRDKINLNLEV